MHLFTHNFSGRNGFRPQYKCLFQTTDFVKLDYPISILGDFFGNIGYKNEHSVEEKSEAIKIIFKIVLFPASMVTTLRQVEANVIPVACSAPTPS